MKYSIFYVHLVPKHTTYVCNNSTGTVDMTESTSLYTEDSQTYWHEMSQQSD